MFMSPVAVATTNNNDTHTHTHQQTTTGVNVALFFGVIVLVVGCVLQHALSGLSVCLSVYHTHTF